jgi:outer membrane receptor protein involved in Fe transport
MKYGFARFAAALFLAVVLCTTGVEPVCAQTVSGGVSGVIVDRQGALPVVGATVNALRAGHIAGTNVTDGSGHFTIGGLAPGVYTLTISARGYQSAESDDVVLASGTMVTFDASLSLSQSSAGDQSTVIGRTSARSSLSAATTISQQISAAGMTNTGQIRVVNQLSTLPATNISTSSSVGDDTSLNLRGLGTDETAVLLDGHPVGPLGVGSGGFNFSLGPAFGLSQVNVTYGSGAQGLFGSDTIGGAVNFVTISPTRKPQFLLQQQAGGFGTLSTGITATGTTGKLGYALAYGRLGEYGDFTPGLIAQAARPNNVQPGSVNPNAACLGQPDPNNPGSNLPEVSACNLALNTYAVSQNTQQSVNLGKLTYAISPVTTIGASVYDAVQWSDSTGNGDNDYLPYSTRLGQVESGSTNCTTANGAAGYTVSTDPIAMTTSCYTAQQLTAATYGPDGGGAGRQRSTSMRDYSGTFTTKAGNNTITLSGFANNYVYWKDSSLSGGIDANGNFLGTPTFADYYNTQGFLVSDEIATGPNDLTFGYTTWHQLQDGVEDDASGINPKIPTGYFGEWSYFARDDYMFSNAISFFVNAWIKHSSVSERTTFDPRATLQFRPTKNDVFQLTYGRSDGAPSPQLKLAGTAIAADPGASLTSVSCTGYNDVTSAGNPNLQSESANDFEAGYGHRFNADSNVQINAYVTAVTNQLFSASQPLLAYGINNVTFAPGALQTYLNRLQTQCPGQNITAATLPQYLSVSTTYNAAQALARGIEFSGRQRFLKIAYIDFGYYIESSTKTGISDAILASNPTVVNGAQQPGIPLHQATISLDVAPKGFEFRVDNYYTGDNNGYNRPAFWRTDAFISHTFREGSTLTLGGTNLFNQAVQYYGYLGLGTAPITNNVAGGAPAPSEEFGIAPAQLTFTFQQKI